MSTLIDKLPCGIKQSDGEWANEIELRPTCGEEEDILGDATTVGRTQRLLKTPYRRITEVLARCTERIGTERRPSNLQPDTQQWHEWFVPHWENAFMADRGFAVIRLRQISVDDVYYFPATCHACGKEIEGLSIDLSTLKVTPMKTGLAQSPTHTVKCPSGKVAEWRMLRGTDEPLLEEIISARKDELMSALLHLRLVSYDGRKLEFAEVRKLRTADRTAIRQAFDTVEGGIDTTVYFSCDNKQCGMELQARVPVGDPGFFFPSGTPSSSKVISASSQKRGATPRK